MVSADYIVGLTDGEGCFYVNISQDKRYPNSRPKVETHFYIKLHEEDLPLLQEVRESLRGGFIYLQKEKRPNHSQCYRFEINSQRDIHGIILPFFRKHPLQSKKQKDFEIFKEIAMMVKEKKHLESVSLEKIRQLKSVMNHGARRMREIRLSGGNAK
jgi:hypothetical protein